MLETAVQWLVSVLAATLVFTVGIPLLGFLAGLVVRVTLPYLLVPAAAQLLLAGTYPEAASPLALAVLVLLWSVLVLGARQALDRRHALQLSWFQGHYRAAASLLSLGGLVRLALPVCAYLNRHIPEEELELTEN